VKIATDGAAGLALAREFRPEVLLLDIGLPRLSGYDIARQVRGDPAFEHAIIIAVTGYGQPQDRAKSREAGFDHHLTKPVEFPGLRQLLKATTSRAGT
jgi:two-component system CheB/CheR fusion protein